MLVFNLFIIYQKIIVTSFILLNQKTYFFKDYIILCNKYKYKFNTISIRFSKVIEVVILMTYHYIQYYAYSEIHNVICNLIIPTSFVATLAKTYVFYINNIHIH